MNISGVVRKGIMFGLLESMRICPGCGKAIPLDCNFCPRCGFNVSEGLAFVEKHLQERFPPGVGDLGDEDLDECTYPEEPRGPGRGLGRYAGQRLGRGVGVRRLAQRNPNLGLFAGAKKKDGVESDSDVVVSDEDVYVTVKDVKDVLKSLRRREKKL